VCDAMGVQDTRMWQRIDLKDILDLNGFNMNYFIQLFSKKLSLLKDQDMDCSNPNVYLKLVQKTFLVLETGIQLHIARKNRYEEPTSIPLTMSWDELKPILKQ
jgi:hypothetical protein